MPSKNQHYVPRFLLKHFSNESELIWVLDKHSKRIFQTNIKNIASEKDFYNSLSTDYKYVFETALSNTESDISPIIKTIISSESINFLQENDKVFLSNFIALQFVRTKQHKARFSNLSREINLEMKEKGWIREGEIFIPTLSEQELKRYHLNSLIEAEELFAPHFLNKKWLLLKSDTIQSIYFSDSPVVMQNEVDHGPRGNLGLAVEGIKIYLPLTPKLVLGFWCKSHEINLSERYKKMCESGEIDHVESERRKLFENFIACLNTDNPISLDFQGVINQNFLQTAHSHRYVYSFENDFGLALRLIESNPIFIHGDGTLLN